MLYKLRKLPDGKWVFDHGDHIEYINSNRSNQVYECSKGRYIKQGASKLRIYIEVYDYAGHSAERQQA